MLAHDDDAILLERATGTRSLAEYARNGRDDEATRIICDAGPPARAARQGPPPLRTLESWFVDLWPMAQAQGGILADCARHARALLDDPRDPAVLHGDVHHDNILDFGERGWLVIDPKRLHGERAFDYANIFCNPDLADPRPPVAIVPGCFDRRFALITTASGLEPRRLLQWIAAWCGLSAAWFMGDGDDAAIDLNIAGQGWRGWRVERRHGRHSRARDTLPDRHVRAKGRLEPLRQPLREHAHPRRHLPVLRIQHRYRHGRGRQVRQHDLSWPSASSRATR